MNASNREPRRLRTSDGVELEAECVLVEGARAGFVLCHPHPQYGGNMQSMVTGALFQALPTRGFSVLRFNFRGVDGSGGEHSGGALEPLDVAAAIAEMDATLGGAATHSAATPLILQGWSFGADMALSVTHERVGAWFAVAPPMRWAEPTSAIATDPRRKLIALGQHDQVRAPAEVEQLCAAWAKTECVTVGGADHFFVGRTDRLVELAVDLANDVAGI